MIRWFARSMLFVFLLSRLGSNRIWAQDQRAQYPRFLSNSYVGMNVGFIDYAFTTAQMTSGFNAASVGVPHLAVRALLFGHEFNKYVSGQVSYLRPVEWVRYQNVNGDRSSHSVWMNVAGATIKARVPLSEHWLAYGEAGLGLITRKGFDIDGRPALKDAEYATPLLGTGIEYRLNRNWSVGVGSTISPKHQADVQPRTSFFSAGFSYTMRPLLQEHTQASSDTTILFPKDTVQLGYVTNALGYGVNDFFSKGAVPLFWAANVQVAHGASVNYLHNTFHTRRRFSLDWGTGVSAFKSQKNGESFVTASVYPVLRFTLVRTRPADLYVDYSLAGPTFISRTVIDGSETGRHFTFQDFMGGGMYMDRRRRINAEIRIMHYSNGNLFPRNPGVTIPLVFNIGYTF
jgi:hypothetical protein